MATRHASLDGPLVIIGCGSITRGLLPLLERHIGFDHKLCTVIEPDCLQAGFLSDHGVRHLRLGLTNETYRAVLGPLLSPGTGFLLNLAVNVSSYDLMRFCQERGVLYLDTVTEPWPGFYFADNRPLAGRTNASLRAPIRALKAHDARGPTAVSCCGANPGAVSWLLKEALLRLAHDGGLPDEAPASRDGWARLMGALGVKGVHIAERDTQVSARPKPAGTFVNSWSVDGLLSEGYQPAELGWGSHERTLPPGGQLSVEGYCNSLWLNRPGAETRVRSWCPGHGAQMGYLITHNEALSIADYYSIDDGSGPVYRPTSAYVYHPCNDAILSFHETSGAGRLPDAKHILTAEEIVSGGDELGLLLYGPERALWYGSRLSIDEARRLAPGQNATTLQVTSAVLAAMVWAIENPQAGIVEADEMDHVRCQEIQRPYLGRVEARYTDWTPLTCRIGGLPPGPDDTDPWQFSNFLVD